MVILSGYPKDMERFMQTNPGLSSRFPENGRVFFEDYTDEELAGICMSMISDMGRITDPASKDFLTYLIGEKRKNAPVFDNARGVRNLVESAVTHADSRLMDRVLGSEDLSLDDLNTLLREDFL